MMGLWTNPFGISDQIKVGNIAMSVEGLLAQFPSGFGFSGELDIGKAKGQLAFNLSEDPLRKSLPFPAPDPLTEDSDHR